MAENADKLAVAKTILQQLGGNKFSAMTGAKNFVADGDSLSFAIPSTLARNGINRVKVALDRGTDTYEVTYTRVRGTKVTTVAERAGVYADQLCENFKSVTGLDTRL